MLSVEGTLIARH